MVVVTILNQPPTDPVNGRSGQTRFLRVPDFLIIRCRWRHKP